MVYVIEYDILDATHLYECATKINLVGMSEISLGFVKPKYNINYTRFYYHIGNTSSIRFSELTRLTSKRMEWFA